MRGASRAIHRLLMPMGSRGRYLRKGDLKLYEYGVGIVGFCISENIGRMRINELRYGCD